MSHHNYKQKKDDKQHHHVIKSRNKKKYNHNNLEQLEHLFHNNTDKENLQLQQQILQQQIKNNRTNPDIMSKYRYFVTPVR